MSRKEKRLGFFQSKRGERLVFNSDIMDDFESSSRQKEEKPNPYATLLFRNAERVAELVRTPLSPGQKWVSIPADWWRKYAQAAHIKESPQEEGVVIEHTLPAKFDELQPGYFMQSDEDRKKLLADLNEPKALPRPLPEHGAIHEYVNIPLDAYRYLLAETNKEEWDSLVKKLDQDKCIHDVVEVTGQRGVKGPKRKEPDGKDTMKPTETRPIVDTARIRFTFVCERKKKGAKDGDPLDSLKSAVEFPSNCKVGEAFLKWFKENEEWFNNHGVTEKEFKKMVFRQDIVYEEFEKEEKSEEQKNKQPEHNEAKLQRCYEYSYSFEKHENMLLWDTHMAVENKIRVKVIDDHGNTREADESIVRVVSLPADKKTKSKKS